MKKFFISKGGDVHFGNISMKGFVSVKPIELKGVLKTIKSKRLWRCTVCNDLYAGDIPPEICPSCFAEDAYVKINEKEFMEMIK